MKSIKNFFIYFITFECLLISSVLCLGYNKVKNAKAINNNLKNTSICNKTYQNLNNFTNKSFYKNNDMFDVATKFNFLYQGKIFEIKKGKYFDLSKIRGDIVNLDIDKRREIMNFAYNNGFSLEESVNYSFPEIRETIDNIDELLYKKPLDAHIKIEENTGGIKTRNSQNGLKIDKNKLYMDVFNEINNNFANKNIKIETEELVANNECFSYNNLKSTYKTNFKSSGEARKNNIRVALACFDGIILDVDEEISFNNTTGFRNEENGYMKAKTIINGTFVPEYGGGVCQVSTTLYNAALLAGLEIIEVHPHSLPVSYEMPCFDAMVNSGSSDLIIKNNTKYPIIIATSSKNDECLVNIYGVKNIYEIVRKFNKNEEILQFDKFITTDYKKYGIEKPLDGESVIVSKGKAGLKAEGVLEYYKDGVLIKTKKIRSNTYKPTNEVIVVCGQSI